MRGVQMQRVSRSALLGVRIAFIFHGIAAVVLISTMGADAFVREGDYYFWLSLILAAIYHLAGKRVHYPAIGGVLAGVSAIFLTSSSFLSHNAELVHRADGETFLLLGHVLPALLAEALLLFASIVSVVFLIKEYGLKKRTVAPQHGVAPSIMLLTKLSESFIFWAFMAMGGAVASGVLWAIHTGKPLITDDPLQWITLISWAMLALIINGRNSRSWSVKKAARVTIATVVMFYVMVGSAYLFSGRLFHG
jgi:ABC-type uncharacterized transport system permease subunit